MNIRNISILGLALMLLASFTFNNDGEKKTKKTQGFTVTRTINASAEKVWAVVGDDFGGIAKSHPQIVSSSYNQGSITHGDEGAERICNLDEKGKKYIKERMEDFDAENYYFKVQIFHTQGMPIDPNYSFGTYKVKPIDENSCELIMKMVYRTKPAMMGAVAKGKFKQTLSDYLLAVDHYVTTGEEVNKDNFKNIKKQYNE